MQTTYPSCLTTCLFVAVLGFCQPVLAVEFQAALASIQADDVQATVNALADDSLEGREAGSRGGQTAARYLRAQLAQYGLRGAGDAGAFLQPFAGTCANVLGMLEGADPELQSQYVVIGAHYDHVGYGTARNSRGPLGLIHNGADDNASGVAGVLEVAAAFAMLDDPPRRSVLFAFWDGEEKGLWGSKHWLAHPTRPLRDVLCLLNADMIGRLRGQTVKVFGTRTSVGLRKLVSLANRSTDLMLDFAWDLRPDSDHHPFFSHDIPVMMWHTGLHDDFHRPSDDADKINSDGAAQVARLVFTVAYELARQPERVVFRPDCRLESAAERQVLEQPAPPAAPRLGATWTRPAESLPGVLVAGVTPGLAAARAGLRPGDRLLRFARREVIDADLLRLQVLAARSPVEVVVQRSPDQTLSLAVALDGEPIRLGISWREDPAEPGSVVLSRVTPGSAAERAGLSVGDRLYQVGGQDFDGGATFQSLIRDATSPLDLLIERQGRLRRVTVADLPPGD